MGFQSQEPVFVQRARQVASLHMAYQLKYRRPYKGLWAFGAQPQPLSVQSPNPTEQAWHGRAITAVCVTLRYPGHWQVRVYMELTQGDGHECCQWRVLRMDSRSPYQKDGEQTYEGKRLYRLLVKTYGMNMSDLATTFAWRPCAVEPKKGQNISSYCMANGEEIIEREYYDWVGDRLRRRVPMPAHLFVSPIYEAA